MRICNICGKAKPLTDYWSTGYSNGKKMYKGACRPCYYDRVKSTFHRRLREIFGELRCLVCGYDKNLAALDFHHVDERGKDMPLSRLQTASFKRLQAEAEKCIILCSNCHREVHHPDLHQEGSCVLDFLDES